MKYYYSLVDGTIEPCVVIEREFSNDEVVVEINGERNWVVGYECCDIDDLIDGGYEELILYREYGYRGVCCYDGIIKVNGKWWWLDIMSDYVAYELVQE